MGICDFKKTCYFLNVKIVAMPLTTKCLKDKYCCGDFNACAIYKTARIHGIDKVPRYLYPDDRYELPRRYLELVIQSKLNS